MVILIDAYNMLKQLLKGDYIDESQQKKYLERLSTYAQAKGHTLIVVFDGGSSKWPNKTIQGPLEIIYSGWQISADEVIKQRIPLLLPDNAVLVTSDRALRDYASQAHIISIEPLTFSYYSRIRSAARLSLIKDASEPHKLVGHQSSREVDELMKSASSIMLQKDTTQHEDGHPKKQGAHKLSKQERKLARIMSKL